MKLHALTLAASLALLAPLALFAHPAILDHPFETARLAILLRILEPGAGPDDYLFAGWRLPNALGDGLGVMIGAWLPADVAARCVIALALGLQVVGTSCLAAALRHPQPAIPGLAATLLACNYIAAVGLTNFQLGTGLALIVLAAFLWLRERSRRGAIALVAIASPLVAAAHVCAWLACGAAIGGVTLQAIGRDRDRHSLRDALVLAIAAILPAVAWLWPWLADPAARQSPSWDVGAKLAAPVGFFVGDPTWRGLVWGGVILFAALVASRELKLRLAPSAQAMVIALTALVLVMPTRTETTMHLDLRIMVPLALVFAAGLRGDVLAGRALHGVVAVVFGLHVMRFVLFLPAWQETDRGIAEIAAAGRSLPSPTVVYVARGVADPASLAEPWSPPIYHAATLLAARPDVYVPQIWAERAQNTILRPAWLAASRELQTIDPLAVGEAAQVAAFAATITALHRDLRRPGGAAPIPAALLVLTPERIRGDLTAALASRRVASGRHFMLFGLD